MNVTYAAGALSTIRQNLAHGTGRDLSDNLQSKAEEMEVVWTGVETTVGETDVLILGTDGVAGREMVQAREICDPTPAISSG